MTRTRIWPVCYASWVETSVSYKMEGPRITSVQGGCCLSFIKLKTLVRIFFLAAAFTLIQHDDKARRVVGDWAARASHIINITVESSSSLCRWCWISKACDGQPQHDTDCSDRKVEPGSTSGAGQVCPVCAEDCCSWKTNLKQCIFVCSVSFGVKEEWVSDRKLY